MLSPLQLDSARRRRVASRRAAGRAPARLRAAGYAAKLIPLFARPGDDGRASGRFIEGAKKGDDWVAVITPRLQALLE